MKNSCLLLMALLMLSGCAGKPEPVEDSIQFDSELSVFYGTDRNRTDSGKLTRFYGFDRGEFEYGVVRLSFSHSKPRLDNVEPLLRENFLGQLDKALTIAEAPTALIFVHGYNKTFNQATTLIGEFSINSGFQGVPVVWSWPSTRNPAGYVEDRNNMSWSRPHFAQFLRAVIEKSSAETIHLVGHSMGAWGLSRVFLEDLLPNGIDLDKIGEFVLMAPDIDTEIFGRDYGPQLVAAGLSITMYVSSNDKAMASSGTLNGYPRAGDSSAEPLILPGIETIDASEANSSILGHSYFEESEVTSRDIAVLLNERKPAAARNGLTTVNSPEGIFWQLLPDR